MVIDSHKTYQYQVGGSLNSNVLTYVVREADDKLYQALMNGEFCYVFNCRQMGKSSLRVRVKNRLQQQGYACASLDMTPIGSQEINPEIWYKSIASELCRGFNLTGKVKFKSWWEEQQGLPPVQKLIHFVSDVILSRIEAEKIFIFIDEVDSVLAIDFPTDDFFTGIRYFYDARAENEAFKRIGITLFGVATPSELIEDRVRTPFNIGTAIALSGFTKDEAYPLIAGLETRFQNPEAVLAAILDWTGGQPFLTQKLCKLAVENSQQRQDCVLAGKKTECVAQLVQQHIVHNWESQDEPPHLRTIRDRLLKDNSTANNLLVIYRQILLNGFVEANSSSRQREFLLTGLVVKKENKLVVYNKIYQEIFNLNWVEQQLDNLRPFAIPLKLWLNSNCQDNSRLLEGKALAEAKEWSTSHDINSEEYQFLLASQVKEEERLRQKLKLDRLQSLEHKFFQEQKLAKLQRFLISSISSALFITIGLGIAVYWQYRKAIVNSIEAHINSSESIFSENRFEAVIHALEAQEETDKLIISNRDLQLQVDLALQQATYNVIESNTFSGHKDIVLGVDFSPDGEQIVSAAADNTVKLWQRNGKLLHTFTGHTDTVLDVTFSPDGETIASASKDGTVRLWNREGVLLRTLSGHQGSVEKVTFSPDGEIIASASEDKTVRLQNKNGTLINVLIGHEKEILTVVFSRDGQTIATGDRQGVVKLWQRSGKLIRSFQAHDLPVRSIDFSPDGQTIVTGGDDNVAKIWTKKGELIRTLLGNNNQQYDAPVTGVKYSPDGKLIGTSSWDGTVKLWYPNGTLYLDLKGHEGRVWRLDWSPDGSTIATAGWDNTVKLWQVRQPLVRTFYGHEATVISVAFHPQGKYIATASDDQTVKLWQPNGTLMTNFTGHNAEVYEIDFSPDREIIASTSLDGTVKLWQPDGTVLATLSGHTAPVNDVVFSPSGKTLISGGADKTIRFWQLNRQEDQIKATEKLKLFAHTASINDLAISNDGKLIASVSNDRTIKLWHPNGDLINSIIADTTGLKTVAISPNKKIIASGGKDHNIKLWTTKGELITTLEGHQGIILDVEFSPDGSKIASASGDNMVKVWDLKGNLLTTLQGHQGRVWNIAFSPDSKQIATVGEDKTVKLWDLKRILSIDPFQYGCDWIADYIKNHQKMLYNHLPLKSCQ